VCPGGVKEKSIREKENKGFFGLFKKSKKTPEQVCTPVSLSGLAVCATCWLSYSGNDGGMGGIITEL